MLPWTVKLIPVSPPHHELGEVQEDARIGMQILMGHQPNVTHNPPSPKAGKKMFHPCSIKVMSTIIGRLPDSQCVAANERDMGMQPSQKWLPVMVVEKVEVSMQDTSLQ